MTLKERLRRKQVTIGSWITIGDQSVAEIMSGAGFEWLAIDMEHSAISIAQCQELIRVIGLCRVAPLVRVGTNDPLLIKRAMDAGAHGVIIPMVNSKEDAENAVSAVRYPPLGERGVGISRAHGYGALFEQYKKWLQKESIVVVQIEHKKAIENLEEILTAKGIDAFIVGPYDLSGSLGRPGDFNCPEMQSVLKHIRDVAKCFKIPMGFHVVQPDVAAALKKIKEGYKLLAFSFDAMLLGSLCRDSLKKIRMK